MQLSEMLVKMARGQTLTESEIQELEQKANVIDAVDTLVSSWMVPGTSTPLIKNLQAENINVPSGEIRVGTGSPGNSFTGVRIAFPALLYNGQYWNLVGIGADVLQVGIRSTDGVLVAGGGNVALSSGGIVIYEGASGQSFLSFYNTTPAESVAFKFAANSLQIQSLIVGGSIEQVLKMTNGDTPYFKMGEDPNQTNRVEAQFGTGLQGTRLEVLGNNGAGAEQFAELRTEGSSGGSTFMRLRETARTPVDPGNGDSMHVYIKGDKFVIQFNDGGTVRYKYLDLTGTGVTWTHTTVAP